MDTVPHSPGDAADIPIVYVIDDEESMRESLRQLLRSAGFAVTTFERAEDFLAAQVPNVPACVIIDVRLKGQSGLALQQRLVASHKHLSVIFMTAHGDIEMSVKAMKRGAFDFFAKPFREQDLLDSVSEGLERARKQHENDRALEQLGRCYRSLTPRERDVMSLIVGGHRNREIAGKLGISEATIKVHRTQAMKKMGAASVAELVVKARQLGMNPLAATTGHEGGH
ncbi:MAG TPA: response regulator [Paraburkholderia sp.]|nr:response regulator [Paraburkholderia sp.]